MAQHLNPHSLDAPSGHSLIGIPIEVDGREVVRYFVDEAEASIAEPSGHWDSHGR